MYILADKSEAGANDSLRAFAWLFTVSRFSERKLKEDNNQRGKITREGGAGRGGGTVDTQVNSRVHEKTKYEKTYGCEQSMQLQFHLEIKTRINMVSLSFL